MLKKKVSLIIMSVFYIIAGINHFKNPVFYLKIMPQYVPAHSQIIFVTGIFEIVFGSSLLISKIRPTAARLIMLMLIAFLPVHIQMIIDTYPVFDKMFVLSVIRLPLQFVLIWWAYKVGKIKFNSEQTE